MILHFSTVLAQCFLSRELFDVLGVVSTEARVSAQGKGARGGTQLLLTSVCRVAFKPHVAARAHRRVCTQWFCFKNYWISLVNSSRQYCVC